VFVIIGSGIAALSAAKAIRDRRKDAIITMIGEEGSLPYSRPMLTKIPLRGSAPGIPPLHDIEWYGENKIDLRLGVKAVALDTVAKTVTLDTGEKLRYDKCVYAAGGAAFVPPGFSAKNAKNIISVRRDSDINSIKRLVPCINRAVVIGGGIIGIELAWELKKAGAEVTIVETAAHILPRILDAQTAGLFEDALKAAGIRIVTGAALGALREDSPAALELAGSLVAVCAGIRPNVALAKAAGIKTGGGVLVDKFMRTSEKDVYACGDCAEFEGLCTGTWEHAKAQGETAGANAASANGGADSLEFQGGAAAVIVNAADTPLYCIGDMGKKPGVKYEERVNNIAHQFAPQFAHLLVNNRTSSKLGFEKYYYAEGSLTGAALIGNLANMEKIEIEINRHNLSPGVNTKSG